MRVYRKATRYERAYAIAWFTKRSYLQFTKLIGDLFIRSGPEVKWTWYGSI
jgi:hypothetical protein